MFSYKMSLDVWNKAFSHTFYMPVRKTQQGCMYFSWNSLRSSMICNYLSSGCLVFYRRCFWNMLWWNLSFLQRDLKSWECWRTFLGKSIFLKKRFEQFVSHCVFVQSARVSLPQGSASIFFLSPGTQVSNQSALQQVSCLHGRNQNYL